MYDQVDALIGIALIFWGFAVLALIARIPLVEKIARKFM